MLGIECPDELEELRFQQIVADTPIAEYEVMFGRALFAMPKELTGGCTDATASNFDEGAQVDDGSCVYATVPEPRREQPTTPDNPSTTSPGVSRGNENRLRGHESGESAASSSTSSGGPGQALGLLISDEANRPYLIGAVVIASLLCMLCMCVGHRRCRRRNSRSKLCPPNLVGPRGEDRTLATDSPAAGGSRMNDLITDRSMCADEASAASSMASCSHPLPGSGVGMISSIFSHRAAPRAKAPSQGSRASERRHSPTLESAREGSVFNAAGMRQRRASRRSFDEDEHPPTSSTVSSTDEVPPSPALSQAGPERSAEAATVSGAGSGALARARRVSGNGSGRGRRCSLRGSQDLKGYHGDGGSSRAAFVAVPTEPSRTSFDSPLVCGRDVPAQKTCDETAVAHSKLLSVSCVATVDSNSHAISAASKPAGSADVQCNSSTDVELDVEADGQRSARSEQPMGVARSIASSLATTFLVRGYNSRLLVEGASPRSERTTTDDVVDQLSPRHEAAAALAAARVASGPTPPLPPGHIKALPSSSAFVTTGSVERVRTAPVSRISTLPMLPSPTVTSPRMSFWGTPHAHGVATGSLLPMYGLSEPTSPEQCSADASVRRAWGSSSPPDQSESSGSSCAPTPPASSRFYSGSPTGFRSARARRDDEPPRPSPPHIVQIDDVNELILLDA